MKHSAGDVLRKLLTDAAKFAPPDASQPPQNQPSWPLYLDALPTAPDEVGVVYNTTGRLEGRLHRTGATIEHPGVQLCTRSTESVTAYDKLAQVRDYIDTVKNVIVTMPDDVRYHVLAVHRRTSLIPLPPEEEELRMRYCFDTILTLKELP